MSDVKYCTRCGQPAKLGDIHCLKCGYEFRFEVNEGVPLEEDLPPPQDTSFPPADPQDFIKAYEERQQMKSIAVLVIVILLALIFIFAGLSIGHYLNPDTSVEVLPWEDRSTPKRTIFQTEKEPLASLVTQVHVGMSAHDLYFRLGAPAQTFAQPNGAALRYHASDGYLVFTIQNAAVAQIQSFHDP